MIEGKVMLLGRDINTDVIASTQYFTGGRFEDKLRYTLYDYDPDFGLKYTPDTILIADTNFGCGSSRESGVTAFKGLKVPAILAESFARTFFRNAINTGLLIFEVPGVVNMFKDGNVARIEPNIGRISNLTTGVSTVIPPMPKEIQQIIDLGGLFPYIKKTMGGE